MSTVASISLVRLSIVPDLGLPIVAVGVLPFQHRDAQEGLQGMVEKKRAEWAMQWNVVGVAVLASYSLGAAGIDLPAKVGELLRDRIISQRRSCGTDPKAFLRSSHKIRTSFLLLASVTTLSITKECSEHPSIGRT